MESLHGNEEFEEFQVFKSLAASVACGVQGIEDNGHGDMETREYGDKVTMVKAFERI